MKKMLQACATAVIMGGIAFTGSFAQGHGDGPGKPAAGVEESVKAPAGPEQRPGMPARDQASRRERDSAIRDFQKALRNAEKKFNADQKAASKLQGEERRAAMQKAADEMKATIKKAEQEKDAVIGVRGPGTRKPKGKMDHPLKDTGEGPVSVDQESAGQADGQLKDGTKSLPDQQKN